MTQFDENGVELTAEEAVDEILAGRHVTEEHLIPEDGPCPAGRACALNGGAVHCFHCRRNWPPDETWVEPRAYKSPEAYEVVRRRVATILSPLPKQSRRCRFGWHKWEYRTSLVRDDEGEVDWQAGTETIDARCARPGCLGYPSWEFTHEERVQLSPRGGDGLSGHSFREAHRSFEQALAVCEAERDKANRNWQMAQEGFDFQHGVMKDVIARAEAAESRLAEAEAALVIEREHNPSRIYCPKCQTNLPCESCDRYSVERDKWEARAEAAEAKWLREVDAVTEEVGLREAAEQSVSALEAALRRYGQHKPKCECYLWDPEWEREPVCNCGLDALLAVSSPAEEQA